ncbi:hypothetical protein B0H17DRAFT_1141892 [Mycena rosella]|uniref:Uncharacterized protein n=1 Tax=Mycena rosella TaxID=1033263 RepID=A0AAD7CYJ2_MYCRO|nr:hypothetical protein B0H17DRAFT_1141892 [Mycena rosella]
MREKGKIRRTPQVSESETLWRWVLKWSRSGKRTDAERTNTKFQDRTDRVIWHQAAFHARANATSLVPKSVKLGDTLIAKKRMEFEELSSDEEDYVDARKHMAMLRLQEGHREGDKSQDEEATT